MPLRITLIDRMMRSDVKRLIIIIFYFDSRFLPLRSIMHITLSSICVQNVLLLVTLTVRYMYLLIFKHITMRHVIASLAISAIANIATLKNCHI